MNLRLIAEAQSSSSSHIRLGWEWLACEWTPKASAGHMNWGYYLSVRWLGFLVDVQLFAPQDVEAVR